MNALTQIDNFVVVDVLNFVTTNTITRLFARPSQTRCSSFFPPIYRAYMSLCFYCIAMPKCTTFNDKAVKCRRLTFRHRMHLHICTYAHSLTHSLFPHEFHAHSMSFELMSEILFRVTQMHKSIRARTFHSWKFVFVWSLHSAKLKHTLPLQSDGINRTHSHLFTKTIFIVRLAPFGKAKTCIPCNSNDAYVSEYVFVCVCV